MYRYERLGARKELPSQSLNKENLFGGAQLGQKKGNQKGGKMRPTLRGAVENRHNSGAGWAIRKGEKEEKKKECHFRKIRDL